MNAVYFNAQNRGPIFVSPALKAQFNIEPDAINNQGNLVDGVSFEGRGTGTKIVAQKRAPMIKWTVSSLLPRNERVRYNVQWEKAIVRGRNFSRKPARNGQVDHQVEMIFALPFGGMVKIFKEVGGEGEDILVAVMQNDGGKILVEMYDQDESPMLEALQEVSAKIAA